MEKDGLTDKAMTALRITDDAFCDEVDGLCKAARQPRRNDPLVVEAVLTYCKARFGLDNPDSEKYWASYLACERDMLNSQEYTVEVGEE